MNTGVLNRLRREIDGIDAEIVALLRRRAEYAREIGMEKRRNGCPIYDPSRERELLDSLDRCDAGELPSGALRNIYREILSACRSLQEPITVAHLGPEGTFSHQAVLQHFGGSSTCVPVQSIPEVFGKVERGEVTFGLVPVENSTEGSVGLTLDRLVTSSAVMCGEVYVGISHCLMAATGERDTIERVSSHPQALAQSAEWLARNLPGRELIHASSTAAGAHEARSVPGTAVVGGALLAEMYGLTILERHIEDVAGNQTRFAVLSRRAAGPTANDKTSIVFSVKHRAGALRQALEPFHRRNINMLRLESRPAKQTPWEYLFFADIEGHCSSENVSGALRDLETYTLRLKALGSYPAGNAVVSGGSERTTGPVLRMEAL